MLRQLLTMPQCGDTSPAYGFARRLSFRRWPPYLKTLFFTREKRPHVNHDARVNRSIGGHGLTRADQKRHAGHGQGARTAPAETLRSHTHPCMSFLISGCSM